MICGFLGQAAIYYSILPDPMASHFNGAGQADSWMSKQGFFALEGVILLIVICEFTFLPFLIKKMPDSLINLPNKNFWLAPERRAETFAAIGRGFEWFSIMLLALFIAVNQLVFRANIRGENLNAIAIWTVLGIFLLFTLIWMIKFIRHFRATNNNK